MAVRAEGDLFYGDSREDLREVLLAYSEATGYVIHHFVDVKCECGGQLFELYTDEEQGVGARVCDACDGEHIMGDGAHYLEEAELGLNECVCGGELFELTAGVSLYPTKNGLSDDVRWFYIGCRCPDCQLIGCYADWKNEFNGYQEFLENV